MTRRCAAGSPHRLDVWAQRQAPLPGRRATAIAALGSIRDNPWIIGLMERLLEGSPPVLGLLDFNPFAGTVPKYVRAQLYDYRFADERIHALTGAWWVRRPQGGISPR